MRLSITVVCAARFCPNRRLIVSKAHPSHDPPTNAATVFVRIAGTAIIGTIQFALTAVTRWIARDARCCVSTGFPSPPDGATIIRRPAASQCCTIASPRARLASGRASSPPPAGSLRTRAAPGAPGAPTASASTTPPSPCAAPLAAECETAPRTPAPPSTPARYPLRAAPNVSARLTG